MTEISGGPSVQRLDRSRKRHSAFPLQIFTKLRRHCARCAGKTVLEYSNILLNAADNLAGKATIYANVSSDLAL